MGVIMGFWGTIKKRVGALFTPKPEIVLDPGTRLLEVSELVPPGFVSGIEVLNDPTTPMPFVVEQLSEHLGLSYQEAAKVMLGIHTRGGALLSLASITAARAAADAISEAARSHGYPLVCRAVSVKSDGNLLPRSTGGEG